MLDEYVVGSVSRICPEAPVPVLDVRSRYNAAGGAANVAVNVAGLGATALLVGFAARDAAGLALRKLLWERSIDDGGLLDAGDRGTICKTRIVAGQQQICRIDHEVTADVTGPLFNELLVAAKERIQRCTLVVLSDYSKGTLSATFCKAIISFAQKVNKPVIVDPKSKTFARYRGCSIITPNVAEAAFATGIKIDSDSSLRRAGVALITQLPGTSILITRGPEGMALFEPGLEPVFIPTVARKVFDVVGAGDTAVATLAVALAASLPIREAVALSNIAAGIVVEKYGTASVSIEELLKHEDIADLGGGLDARYVHQMLPV